MPWWRSGCGRGRSCGAGWAGPAPGAPGRPPARNPCAPVRWGSRPRSSGRCRQPAGGAPLPDRRSGRRPWGSPAPRRSPFCRTAACAGRRHRFPLPDGKRWKSVPPGRWAAPPAGHPMPCAGPRCGPGWCRSSRLGCAPPQRPAGPARRQNSPACPGTAPGCG